MKLTVANYEIEIKAKQTWENRNNEQALMYFLNQVSLAFLEASEHMEEHGKDALAEDYKEKWRDIYKAIEARGFFDN